MDAVEGVLGGKSAVEEGDELGQLRRELVATLLSATAALEGVRIKRSTAGRAADAEIDAPRVEGVKEAEGLDDLHRSVVGQKDGAGADANARCLCTNPR